MRVCDTGACRVSGGLALACGFLVCLWCFWGVSRLAVVPAGLCPRCRCSCAPGIADAIRGMPAVLLGVSGVREHGCAGWVAAGAADVADSADSRCRALWMLRLAIAVRVVYGVRFKCCGVCWGPSIRRFDYGRGVCCGGMGGCRLSSRCIGEFCWEGARGVARGRCLAAGVVAGVLACALAADVSVSSGAGCRRVVWCRPRRPDPRPAPRRRPVRRRCRVVWGWPVRRRGLRGFLTRRRGCGT